MMEEENLKSIFKNIFNIFIKFFFIKQFERTISFANILVFQITVKLIFHCCHSYHYFQNQTILQFDIAS